MVQKFFEERGDQSVVKANIVQKYFAAWSRIVLGTARRFYGGKIAYIDLYAGPGRYRDGSASTPLLILEKAIENDGVRNAIVTYFNDQDQDNSQTLQSEIDKLPGIETLKHKPVVLCNEVGQDAEDYFTKTRRVPSFTFLDPFGYKGLSLKLVNAVIKDWGCDCVFFFNYNRINSGISNPSVKSHMDALFGVERADKLRKKVEGTKPHLREEMILEELSAALVDMGGKFVLPFRFRSDSGRLTHHLIFVSKDFKGYDVMKGIMANESSTEDQGVASFAYSPADESMPLLFELSRPLDELEGMLFSQYGGEMVVMEDLYRYHSVGRRYLRKNYVALLKQLEKDDKIIVVDPENKRRKGTFADRIQITFPKE